MNQSYYCKQCAIQVADADACLSKAFHGRHGKAFLFNMVQNVSFGSDDERLLITGLHVVNDIRCSVCENLLGWKYVKAFEESQKYKEGKCIIEQQRIVKRFK